MNLLKMYIAIALVNALFFIAVVGGTAPVKGAMMQVAQSAADGIPHISPTIAALLPTPTRKPRARIVRIVHKPAPTQEGDVAGASVSVAAAATGTTTTTTGTTASGGSQPTAAPAQVQPTADPRCIITIDGVRYDVTQFRSMHSGGNVFTCGADMSAVFWSRHGQSTLNQMAQFRV